MRAPGVDMRSAGQESHDSGASTDGFLSSQHNGVRLGAPEGWGPGRIIPPKNETQRPAIPGQNFVGVDTPGGRAGHGENFRISFGFRPALVRHVLPGGGNTFPALTHVPFGTGFALETAQDREGLAVPAYSRFFALSHLACRRWLRASVRSGLRSVARRSSFLSVVLLVLPAPVFSGCSLAVVFSQLCGLRARYAPCPPVLCLLDFRIVRTGRTKADSNVRSLECSAWKESRIRSSLPGEHQDPAARPGLRNCLRITAG